MPEDYFYETISSNYVDLVCLCCFSFIDVHILYKFILFTIFVCFFYCFLVFILEKFKSIFRYVYTYIHICIYKLTYIAKTFITYIMLAYMDRVYIQRQSCNKLNTYLKNLTKLLSNTFKILRFMLL